MSRNRITCDQVMAELDRLCAEAPDRIGPAKYRTSDGAGIDVCVIAALLTAFGISQGELRNHIPIDAAPTPVLRRFDKEALYLLARLQRWNDSGIRWGAFPGKAREARALRAFRRRR